MTSDGGEATANAHNPGKPMFRLAAPGTRGSRWEESLWWLTYNCTIVRSVLRYVLRPFEVNEMYRRPRKLKGGGGEGKEGRWQGNKNISPHDLRGRAPTDGWIFVIWNKKKKEKGWRGFKKLTKFLGWKKCVPVNRTANLTVSQYDSWRNMTHEAWLQLWKPEKVVNHTQLSESNIHDPEIRWQGPNRGQSVGDAARKRVISSMRNKQWIKITTWQSRRKILPTERTYKGRLANLDGRSRERGKEERPDDSTNQPGCGSDV
jgi:hypothetical protein